MAEDLDLKIKSEREKVIDAFLYSICNLKFEIFRYHPISPSPHLPIFILVDDTSLVL